MTDRTLRISDAATAPFRLVHLNPPTTVEEPQRVALDEAIAGMIPMGGWGTPEELAWAAGG